MTGNLFYKTENKIMCCNGILALLALIIGFMAIVYLLYQVYSYIAVVAGDTGRLYLRTEKSKKTFWKKPEKY